MRKDSLQELLNYTHWVILNANDFFAWACADCVKTDHLDELGDMIRQFGDIGISAFISHSRGAPPQKPLLERLDQKKFKQAMTYIETRHPGVYKTDLTVYSDIDFEYGKGPLADFFKDLVSLEVYNFKQLKDKITIERGKRLDKVPLGLEIKDIVSWGIRNYYIEESEARPGEFMIVKSMWEEE